MKAHQRRGEFPPKAGMPKDGTTCWTPEAHLQSALALMEQEIDSAEKRLLGLQTAEDDLVRLRARYEALKAAEKSFGVI